MDEYDALQWNSTPRHNEPGELTWVLFQNADGPDRVYYGALHFKSTGYTVRPAWEIHAIGYFGPDMDEQEAKDAAKLLLVTHYKWGAR